MLPAAAEVTILQRLKMKRWVVQNIKLKKKIKGKEPTKKVGRICWFCIWYVSQQNMEMDCHSNSNINMKTTI